MTLDRAPCLSIDVFSSYHTDLGAVCHFPRYAIARRTAGGSGASCPLIDRQRISLSSKSSILSYSSKSILSERTAP